MCNRVHKKYAVSAAYLRDLTFRVYERGIWWTTHSDRCSTEKIASICIAASMVL